jgi:hypothetical protein
MGCRRRGPHPVCFLAPWAVGRGLNLSIHFRHTPTLLRLTRNLADAPIQLV